MASVNFMILTNGNPSQIYLRLIRGEASISGYELHILINPKRWDVKKRRVRNIASAHQKNLINTALKKLSALFRKILF